ncbi:universal stress protein [Flavobacterium sp. CS20]|uniref:universal stress protein n=1 Tax=Flavobacterium sp. CS20 TaxID=2775246 RepID=UPI001B3A0FB3|nr:universal stress protein [Flavobacterium sp. CS20]QTY28038.1 universal stress protein [Flavobacterium sp. CS20]
MKKILVPTDFSPEAENALKVLAQIAKNFDSEIFLLHMLELPLDLIDPSQPRGTGDLPEALFFMKLAHQRFNEVMKKDYLKGIKVNETVEFHEAFDGIMEISKKHQCDVIIMGSSGADGLKEIFIGSNTEKVVRHSEIPVLVIKKEIPLFEVKKFVFATDLDSESIPTFKKAIDFANKLDTTIELVMVNTASKFSTTDEIDDKLKSFTENIDEADYQFSVYNDVNVETGILNYGNKINADLIGISTHGRKGLAHFINGSLSEDLVNHAKRPIVTFKI